MTKILKYIPFVAKGKKIMRVVKAEKNVVYYTKDKTGNPSVISRNPIKGGKNYKKHGRIV